MAERSDCPLAALEKLATDKQPSARRAVLSRSDSPPSLVAVLAGDPRESLRVLAARHDNCDPDVGETLTGDRRAGVRAASCRSRTALRASPGRSLATGVRRWEPRVASRPDCPEGLLVSLSTEACSAVAMNRSTPNPRCRHWYATRRPRRVERRVEPDAAPWVGRVGG